MHALFSCMASQGPLILTICLRAIRPSVVLPGLRFRFQVEEVGAVALAAPPSCGGHRGEFTVWLGVEA